MSEQKTPEQIAAELELQAQEKAAQEKAAAEAKAAEEKAAAALRAAQEKAGEVHFVANGKVYVPVYKSVNIPGIGVRTALEICVDEAAQAYLLAHGQNTIREIL